MACPSHMVVKEDHFIRFSSDRNYPQPWGTRPAGRVGCAERVRYEARPAFARAGWEAAGLSVRDRPHRGRQHPARGGEPLAGGRGGRAPDDGGLPSRACPTTRRSGWRLAAGEAHARGQSRAPAAIVGHVYSLRPRPGRGPYRHSLTPASTRRRGIDGKQGTPYYNRPCQTWVLPCARNRRRSHHGLWVSCRLSCSGHPGAVSIRWSKVHARP
jgi:hypothetical protein